jgi:hypothetical protein
VASSAIFFKKREIQILEMHNTLIGVAENLYRMQRGLETVRSRGDLCFIYRKVTLCEFNDVRACCPRTTQQPIRIRVAGGLGSSYLILSRISDRSRFLFFFIINFSLIVFFLR